MARLHFTLDGKLILGEGRTIQVWDLNTRRRIQTYSGGLIGVDRQGRALLLETAEGELEARDAARGDSLPLADLDPGRFALAQRTRIQTGTKAVEVEDVLTGEAIYHVELETLAEIGVTHPYCDRAVLPNEGEWLAVSVCGDSSWGAWAHGFCLGPDGKPRFELNLNPEAQRPLLVASPAGRFLLAEHQPGRYELVDPASGETLTVFHLADPSAGGFAAMWDAEGPPRLVLRESEQAVGVHWLGTEPQRMGTFETPAAVETGVFITSDHLALLLADGRLVVYGVKPWSPVYELDLRAE